MRALAPGPRLVYARFVHDWTRAAGPLRIPFPAMPEFLTDLKRTHDCGALRASDAGHRAVLYGWVHARRDHGGCVFIDLRDRGGLTQVVFEPATGAEAHAL